jgi:pantothenate synthetase
MQSRIDVCYNVTRNMLVFVIIEQEKGGAAPSSHARALVTLERQTAALIERELKLKKEKEHLMTAIEQESLHLQRAREAHEKVDKALKDMESLETEENKGCVMF